MLELHILYEGKKLQLAHSTGTIPTNNRAFKALAFFLWRGQKSLAKKPGEVS